MDEQPSTQTPSWLTIDLTIIALSAIVIAIGIWMGLWRPTGSASGIALGSSNLGNGHPSWKFGNRIIVATIADGDIIDLFGKKCRR
jgi:hypothetical protein